MTAITDILDFWFRETSPDSWFSADSALDSRIRERFADAHEAAGRGALDDWTDTPKGTLALVIVVDQFSRNLHRGTPRAFALDGRARQIALEALDRGDDQALCDVERQFLYLPLQHSESLSDQELSVRLAEERTSLPVFQDFARRHRDIIARFGRFPHRNRILGRESTPEESEFLEQPGSSF